MRRIWQASFVQVKGLACVFQELELYARGLSVLTCWRLGNSLTQPNQRGRRSLLGSRIVCAQSRERDGATLVVPCIGCVAATDDPLEPYRLLDADGAVVAPVATCALPPSPLGASTPASSDPARPGHHPRPAAVGTGAFLPTTTSPAQIQDQIRRQDPHLSSRVKEGGWGGRSMSR